MSTRRRNLPGVCRCGTVVSRERVLPVAEVRIRIAIRVCVEKRYPNMGGASLSYFPESTCSVSGGYYLFCLGIMMFLGYRTFAFSKDENPGVYPVHK